MKALISFCAAAALTVLAACGDNDVAPRFRLRNGAPDKASVQIKTSGGNTININNVDPGYLSAYQNSTQGQIDVTATVQGDTTTLTGGFKAFNNESYTILIADPPAVKIIME